MTGTLQLAPVTPRRRVSWWRRHQVAIGVVLVLGGPAAAGGAEVARLHEPPNAGFVPYAASPGVPVIEGPGHPTMSVEAASAPAQLLVVRPRAATRVVQVVATTAAEPRPTPVRAAPTSSAATSAPGTTKSAPTSSETPPPTSVPPTGPTTPAVMTAATSLPVLP